MTLLRFIASTLPAALFLIACGGTTDLDNGGNGNGNGSGNGAGDWMVLHECTGDAPTDPIEVLGIEVDYGTTPADDRLHIEVAHSGGCAEHRYGVCWESAWDESYPVQIRLEMLHDSGQDTCEAYEMPTVAFDLAPLRQAYEDAYLSDSGAVSLRLESESVTYTWGEDSGSGGSSGGGTGTAPTFRDIERAASELDSCTDVADCTPVAVDCSSVYVNVDADTTALQALVDEYHDALYGGDTFACPAICQCGALSCTDGRCTTASSDCSEPEAGSQSICL